MVKLVAKPAPVDGLLHYFGGAGFRNDPEKYTICITIVCYYILCNNDLLFSSERGWEIGQATFKWRISSW